jgi:uncharacterized protein YqeY
VACTFRSVVSIKQKISDDMKAAMRARDSARLGAIRLLQAAIKQREVDERIELSDSDVLGVLDKMVKQRRDSIAQFEAAGRQELADKEKFEIDVLQAYMPQQLSAAEIDAIIEQALATSGASGPQDMGKVMGLLKPQLAGRADLGKVSGLVKARLSR